MIRNVQPDWLTCSQVAELCDEETQAIYRWIREGLLPATDTRRKGKKKPRYRISRTDAQELANKLSSGLPAGA